MVFIQNGDKWTYGVLTPHLCQLIVSCHPPCKLIHSPPLMAGHLRWKKCKLQDFWAKFVKKKWAFLPIKGVLNFQHKTKQKPKVMFQKFQHQKPSTSHPKPSPSLTKNQENFVWKQSFYVTGFVYVPRADFVKFFSPFQPKSVGYLGCETKKKIWVLTNNHRAFVRVIPRSFKTHKITTKVILCFPTLQAVS